MIRSEKLYKYAAEFIEGEQIAKSDETNYRKDSTSLYAT
nr:MAG TPA: hypothetical protein [Caudoviricetes sp.]